MVNLIPASDDYAHAGTAFRVRLCPMCLLYRLTDVQCAVLWRERHFQPAKLEHLLA